MRHRVGSKPFSRFFPACQGYDGGVLRYTCSVLLLYTCTVPVEVSNGDDLSSNIVVESVERAGEDEAVSHPNPRLHHLWDLPQDLVIRT